jgi:hypothetical protein
MSVLIYPKSFRSLERMTPCPFVGSGPFRSQGPDEYLWCDQVHGTPVLVLGDGRKDACPRVVPFWSRVRRARFLLVKREVLPL